LTQITPQRLFSEKQKSPAAEPMTLETLLGKYKWIENWITIPESPLGKMNGRTHGIAALKNGEIVVFHQADPALLHYSSGGILLKAWGNYPGAHGLTLIEEEGEELLWLVDQDIGEVVKATLDGRILLSLKKPNHEAYSTCNYVPTWAAVAEDRFGGNGDIWVADGYGASLVHRFDRSGNYLSTLDGKEGGGRFDCPHGLALDTRGREPEFYIADRGNRRFQVYGMDGTDRRTFGEGFLDSPDISTTLGDHLIIPELKAGITILNSTDEPVASLGVNPQVASLEGWPNNRKWVAEGAFNSPHSATTDPHGNIYIVEWITGGRVTKLERLS